MLFPPEDACLKRVASRVDHGFTDLNAALHMYKELAGAVLDEGHILTSATDAAAIASRLSQLVLQGSLTSRVSSRRPAR